jgi:elongator complex protein 3
MEKPKSKPNKKNKDKADENVLHLKNISEIITRLI